MKEAASIPLKDTKSKRPVKGTEREEEEEDGALPLDMRDAVTYSCWKIWDKASFLTRDLSSGEPVHIKKQKHEGWLVNMKNVKNSAALASAVLSDPEGNIEKLEEMFSMLMEQDPGVAVTVGKVVIISLMELFKDIAPSYKMRPLTEAEKKSSKIHKETQKLRELEEGLLSQYKFYLEIWSKWSLEAKEAEEEQRGVLDAYQGLAEAAVESACAAGGPAPGVTAQHRHCPDCPLDERGAKVGFWKVLGSSKETL